MNAQAFTPPVITLPAPALSRRWLALTIEQQSAGHFFKRLLKRYAPDALAGCKQHWRAWYQALIKALDDKLPLDWLAYELADDAEDVQELIEWGIPITVCGIYGESLFDGTSKAYSLAACISGFWDISFEGQFAAYPGLTERASYCHPRFVNRRFELPNGYAWREPWGAISDLYLYVQADTGNAFLDYSDEEGQMMNPRWSIGELNALIHEWRLGEPRLAAIERLQKYIDEQPDQQLPMLVSVLAGEWTPEVLAEVARKGRAKRG